MGVVLSTSTDKSAGKLVLDLDLELTGKRIEEAALDILVLWLGVLTLIGPATMTDIGTKLEERFQNTLVLLRYSNELIGLLESEESVLNEVRSLADTTSKVYDKAEKAKQATAVTKQGTQDVI